MQAPLPATCSELQLAAGLARPPPGWTLHSHTAGLDCKCAGVLPTEALADAGNAQGACKLSGQASIVSHECSPPNGQRAPSMPLFTPLGVRRPTGASEVSSSVCCASSAAGSDMADAPVAVTSTATFQPLLSYAGYCSRLDLSDRLGRACGLRLQT